MHSTQKAMEDCMHIHPPNDPALVHFLWVVFHPSLLSLYAHVVRYHVTKCSVRLPMAGGVLHCSDVVFVLRICCVQNKRSCSTILSWWHNPEWNHRQSRQVLKIETFVESNWICGMLGYTGNTLNDDRKWPTCAISWRATGLPLCIADHVLRSRSTMATADPGGANWRNVRPGG